MKDGLVTKVEEKKVEKTKEEASKTKAISKIENGVTIENTKLEEKSIEEPKKFNDCNGLIKGIKRVGVSNYQMIPAIKENIDNEGILKLLLTTYPNIFKGSARYLPTKMKPIALKLIKEVFPDFELVISNKPITNEVATGKIKDNV